MLISGLSMTRHRLCEGIKGLGQQLYDSLFQKKFVLSASPFVRIQCDFCSKLHIYGDVY